MLNNGIGSSKCTQDKQDGFERIISLHVKIISDVMKNFQRNKWYYPPRYQFIDTNAGDGLHPFYGEGSPVIFLKAVEAQGIPYHGHFIEKDTQNAEQLSCVVQKLEFPNNYTIYNGDHTQVISQVVKTVPHNSFGMVYMDPNGLPSLGVLQFVANQLPKLEILIRVPTRVLKRVRLSPKCDGYSLLELIQKTPKSAWLIRDTYELDTHQDWTFLLGSNYTSKSKRSFMEWKKQRFYGLQTEEGQAILHRLNYTKAEKEQFQTQPKEAKV